jgi:peptidyl-prolyl cis-trans isomerase SurA
MPRKILRAGTCLLLLVCLPAAAQEKGQVIEAIVARVNNDVITTSDLAKAKVQLRGEVEQDCPQCTPAQVNERYAAQEKNVLRDLIDNSLLVQRAKDLDINVDTDVVKRLDEIRQQNNIPSMEELQKRVEASGLDYEDFKSNIRNQLLQQEVIRREVTSKIIVDHSEVMRYYNAHKQDFVHPEQVVLREIFVSTQGKAESEIPALRKKADGLLQRIKNGDDFSELAKRFSDGSTAKNGGDLGTFGRGQLAPNLETIAFQMKAGQVTNVIPTKTGFLILKVEQHYVSGLQPESKVEDQILNRLYSEKMKPALRDYLANLRENSYVDVRPGYLDTAAVSASNIEELPATPDADPDSTKDNSKKKSGHRLLPFGKKKNGA